jgi:hypothetical protein
LRLSGARFGKPDAREKRVRKNQGALKMEKAKSWQEAGFATKEEFEQADQALKTAGVWLGFVASVMVILLCVGV